MYFLEQTGSSVELEPDLRGRSMDPKMRARPAPSLRTDAGITAKLLGNDLCLSFEAPFKDLASCQGH